MKPDDPELKRVHTLAGITDNSCASMHERWSKFPSWQTLRKVVLYCLLYKKILRCKVESRQNPNAQKPSAELNVELLREAESEIIKSAQRFAFPEEVASLEGLGGKGLKSSSPLRKLDPFLDNDGTLRVGGRLEKSTMSDMLKHSSHSSQA